MEKYGNARQLFSHLLGLPEFAVEKAKEGVSMGH